MCYHTSQQKNIKDIQTAFGLPVKNEELFQQGYQLNGFSKPYLPVISNSDSNAISMYKWGLIPFWVNETKVLSKPIHLMPVLKNCMTRYRTRTPGVKDVW